MIPNIILSKSKIYYLKRIILGQFISLALASSYFLCFSAGTYTVTTDIQLFYTFIFSFMFGITFYGFIDVFTKRYTYNDLSISGLSVYILCTSSYYFMFTRPQYYLEIRYLEWSATTPMMIYMLLHLDVSIDTGLVIETQNEYNHDLCSHYVVVIIVDLAMIVFGYIANFEGFFFFVIPSVLCFIYLMYNVYVKLRHMVSLLEDMWKIYIQKFDKIDSANENIKMAYEYQLFYINFVYKMIFLSFFAFPTVWFMQQYCIISIQSSEFFYGICDIMSKFILVSMLVRCNILSMDTTRINEIKILHHNLTSEKLLQQNKNEFIRYVFHEIRVPIQAIMSATEELSQFIGDCSEDTKSLFRSMNDGIHHIERILNNTLCIQKMESGKLENNFQICNVEHLVKVICDGFQAFAKKKQINILMKIKFTRQRFVTDPIRIEQVLSNLISNAIKYGFENTTLTIISEERDKSELMDSLAHVFIYPNETTDYRWLYVSVINEGNIIPPEKLDKLFIPFSRLQTEEHFGSSGLGLSICKRIIQHLNGTIKVESNVLIGTKFSFEIPIYYSDSIHKTLSPNVKDNKLENVKCRENKCINDILIVEDVLTIRKLLSKQLSRKGFVVDEAVNGKDVIEKCINQKKKYRVILMDNEMPEMNGPETCVILRREGYNLPIIGLTGHALEQDKEDFKTKGANMVLTKPCTIDVIVEVIKNL